MSEAQIQAASPKDDYNQAKLVLFQGNDLST